MPGKIRLWLLLRTKSKTERADGLDCTTRPCWVNLTDIKCGIGTAILWEVYDSKITSKILPRLPSKWKCQSIRFLKIFLQHSSLKRKSGIPMTRAQGRM